MTDSKRTQAEGLAKKGTKAKKVTAHLLTCGLVLSSSIVPLAPVLAQEASEPTTTIQASQETEQSATETPVTPEIELPVAPVISETPEDTEAATEESTQKENQETTQPLGTSQTKEQASPSSDTSEEFTFTEHYVDENGKELIPSKSYTVHEGVEGSIEPNYLIDSSEGSPYVLNKEQAIPGFDGRWVSLVYSKDMTDITFQYSPRTYYIAENGFWYADDLDYLESSRFVDIDFTFTDKETGEVLATFKVDKYSYNIESGFSLYLPGDLGIDTTKYGILLSSQEYIQHVYEPITIDGTPTDYYSRFAIGRDISEWYNDGAGKMTLVVPLDRLPDTTPPTIDEENRPVLEQTITEAKTYLDKDKYQAKYVDALDTAIKSGEQALADSPQAQTRTLLNSTSTNEKVFQGHIEAINSALADVKANPLANTVDPIDPVDPVDPIKPETPNKIEPTKPNKEVALKDNSTNSLPQTGESNNPLASSLGFGSIAIATLAWFFKRKRT